MSDKEVAAIDAKTQEIANQILETEDIEQVKDLAHLFNLNAQKRNVLRIMKMNGLLDNVTDEIITRFENTPQNFTNEELLRYMQVTEAAIDRANKNLGLVDDTPVITYNQNNQVNISISDEIGTEGRQRVTEVIQSILAKLQNGETVENMIDTEGKDVNES